MKENTKRTEKNGVSQTQNDYDNIVEDRQEVNNSERCVIRNQVIEESHNSLFPIQIGNSSRAPSNIENG